MLLNIRKIVRCLSLNQLDYYRDSLKVPYDEFIKVKAESFYKKNAVKDMYTDSLFKADLNKDILENFDTIGKISVLNNAISASDRTLNNIKGFKKTPQGKTTFSKCIRYRIS